MLLLCTMIPAATAQSDVPHSIVLHAARVLDVKAGRILKPAEVLIQADRIVEVGADGEASRGSGGNREKYRGIQAISARTVAI